MEAVFASSGVEQGTDGGGALVECLGDLSSRFGWLVAAVRRQGRWSYGFRLTGFWPSDVGRAVVALGVASRLSSWVGFQCRDFAGVAAGDGVVALSV